MGTDIESRHGGAMVQMIDEHAWEAAEVVPIGRSVTVEDWLSKMREWGMELSLPPVSHISGGTYDGGRVVIADNERGRLYFAVPSLACAVLADAGQLPRSL